MSHVETGNTDNEETGRKEHHDPHDPDIASVTRSQARGTAIGALNMMGFGAAWAVGAAATASTSKIQVAVAIVCIVAITVALLIPAIILLRTTQALPADDHPESLSNEKWTMRLFYLDFYSEGAAIVLAIIICNVTNHDAYIVPVIALIVGLHFLPLAALFKVWLYYVTGALMIVIPLVVMIAVPATTLIGRANGWMVIPMAGSAVVLWLTTIGVLLMSRTALHSPRLG